MFYEASRIECLILCKICDKKLEDPRLLPCGRSVCHKCVDLLLDTDRRRIKCFYCAKTHDLPIDGFAPNLELSNLLVLKPSKAFRSELTSELTVISNSIQEKFEKIQTDLLTGEAKIRDECDKVRNDVQLAIEEAHLMLDKIHERLMNKIDDYEKECRQNYVKIQKSREKMNRSLNKANNFNAHIKILLNQFHLEETVIQENLNEAQAILNKLEKIEDELQMDLISKVHFKFEKNQSGLNDSTIGFIKRRNVQLYFCQNIDNKKELDLTQNLDNPDSKPFIMVYPFSSSKFLLVEDFDKGNLYFYVIDSNKTILAQKRYDFNFNGTVLKVKLTPLINREYFCLATLAENIKGKCWLIKSFDENLKIISRKYFDKLNFILTNGENLFLGIIKDERYIYLESYNSNLEPLKLFGQEYSDLPYFFPSTIRNILISKKYFVLKELNNSNESKITIIRQKNGKIKSSFLIKFQFLENWTIYLEKFILFFSQDNMTIFCYDFDGILIEKFISDLDISKFKFAVNKELYFLYFNRYGSVKLLKF
jgi:hypothetical protein